MTDISQDSLRFLPKNKKMRLAILSGWLARLWKQGKCGSEIEKEVFAMLIEEIRT